MAAGAAVAAWTAATRTRPGEARRKAVAARPVPRRPGRIGTVARRMRCPLRLKVNLTDWPATNCDVVATTCQLWRASATGRPPTRYSRGVESVSLAAVGFAGVDGALAAAPGAEISTAAMPRSGAIRRTGQILWHAPTAEIDKQAVGRATPAAGGGARRRPA